MDAQAVDQSGGLSVNAAVFIPRNFPPPHVGGPVQSLPTYMTNCFPFVQPDFNGNRFCPNHGNWARGSRPNRYRNSGHHGNRFPAPGKFSQNPLFPFTSPPPSTEGFYNNFVPPPGSYMMNNFSQFPVMPNETGSKSQTESAFEGGNSFTSNNRKRRNQKNRNNNNNSDERGHNSRNNNNNSDNSNRQRKRTNSWRKGPADNSWEPVLVLYEKETQTDFSNLFALKTLKQHPSPLLRKSKGSSHKELDTDSDSGYSSPLHKRNQITIGIQSDSKICVPCGTTTNSVQSETKSAMPWVVTSNNIQSDDPSIISATAVQQQKFSYAFIAQKEPSPCITNSDIQNSNNSQNFKSRQSKTNSGTGNYPSGKYSKNKSKGTEINSYNSNSKNRNDGTMQSKLGKKPTKNISNNSVISTRGDNLKKKTNTDDDSDYGFSRSKNRRQSQENKAINSCDESKNNFGNVEDENSSQGKKKRRRRRRRKKKDGESQEEETVERQNVELHFEDVEEFPDLSSAKVSDSASQGVGILYSTILQSPTTNRNKTSSSEDSPRKDNSSEEPKVTRAGRKRRKKKDLLNKEAENELAEIGLEQQMLKEQCLKTQVKKVDEKGPTPGILKINPKTQQQQQGKKSKQNVSLDLGAVINALEQKKTTISLTTAPRKEQKVKVEQPKKTQQKSKGSHNVLDASAPIKRGKERETPKPKKPSPLKKVILKEREEKKHLRMLDGPESTATEASVGIGVVSVESDLSQDALSTKSSIDYTGGTPGSANLSPVSQTSPISMSPLSPGTSPLSSEVNSPIAGAVGKDVIRKIHSRRFREYCNQVLDKEIDESTTALLQDLVRFQDRMYHKDPNKAKLKRRLVLGLREVTKHLKLRKIKCVIISPNLEKIQSKGGLDDALNNILTLCNEQDVPFVFALGRRALGRACAKLVPVSVVGVFNYSGSEDNFRQLMDLTAKARESYGEMVRAIEKEIKEYPAKMQQQPAIPHVFAHMGHSRTPSGASVLSFTSSILSEPISENYPQSEPETDSKGYEIVKDETLLKPGLPTNQTGYQTQMRIIHSNTRGHHDDGNEADNEDDDRVKKSFRSSDENLTGSVSDLPHIDSIHSSTHDLNTCTDILSQHSGRTLENCEAMSTHSSRTLGDGSSTILAEIGDRSKHGTPKSTESPSNTLQRGKVVDEERIQHWVDETSSRLENLALDEESYEDSTDEMTDESDNDFDCDDGPITNQTNTICDNKTDMSKVSQKLQTIANIKENSKTVDDENHENISVSVEDMKSLAENLNESQTSANEKDKNFSAEGNENVNKSQTLANEKDVNLKTDIQNDNSSNLADSKQNTSPVVTETGDAYQQKHNSECDTNVCNHGDETAPENIEILID